MINEGWNVGSVSVKRVQISDGEVIAVQNKRHGGNLAGVVREMVQSGISSDSSHKTIVTGPLASSIFDLPYCPESVCIEKALRYLQLDPDIVLSLGGESFVVYCIYQGHVRNMVFSSRCAAGSGEFILQQFGRMGLDLDEGLRQAKNGKPVSLASRCSVHIKSDATHKLNKGECSPIDIAYSLVIGQATKIQSLIESTAWERKRILVSGGMSQNTLLVEELRRLMPESLIEIIPESPYLEAFGAAIEAAYSEVINQPILNCLKTVKTHQFDTLIPLKNFFQQVTVIQNNGTVHPKPGMRVILGIDAGSTTTKAVLFDVESENVVASIYLRTHGNPVLAARKCMEEIQNQLHGCQIEIINVAVTGSGRELVSVSMNNCLSFNEILAHARAAKASHPDVDTIFEIGGQDAKFISLLQGIPVDYAMNDGCSAGTGSFLEETSASDMKYSVDEIGDLALNADAPLAFGERCAAFINSEIRTALQSGEDPKNILAGLVYSIVKNYLSRVVGTRHIGDIVLLQGGVALNTAVAPAVAAMTGRKVIVPQNPELMGCVGTAMMANDLMKENKVQTKPLTFQQIQKLRMDQKESFKCKTCKNNCLVQRIEIGDKTYPFGGLCSRWEMQRRPLSLRYQEGQDLVSLRTKIMLEDFAPITPENPLGRIGIPMALTTYSLFPFYSNLLTSMGFEVVLSTPGKGNKKTHAPFCYPGELLHASVDDLVNQNVDWIFLPQVREFSIEGEHAHAYTCSFTEDSIGIVSNFFGELKQKFLTPEIGFSKHLQKTSQREIIKMAIKLGVAEEIAFQGYELALQQQMKFEQTYRKEGQSSLEKLTGPKVILVGRPYVAYNTTVNLSIPRKIASRGFHVIPADLLSFDQPAIERNVWHFTQMETNAIQYAKHHKDVYICFLSCFSCNPDAIIYHRVRSEMEGEPFCFLEIDSHTADAGIDTRIGAFMDIIEERREMERQPEVTRNQKQGTYRIEYNHRKPKIITEKGEMLGFDDERVVHVLLADTPAISTQLFISLYSRMGWKVKLTPMMDAKILQAARKVCSGRECLPFLAMIGKLVLYLENRDPNEVTLFHMLEQEGPCQIGNWFDASHILFQRMGVKNAFTVWPRIENNYLGGGEIVALSITAACTLGDMLSEVRSALTCLAKEPRDALEKLDAIEDRLISVAEHGIPAIELALPKIAKELREIPLAEQIETHPKVLLFSGVNRIFVDKPVQRYFEEHGILSKTGDLGEFLCFFETEPIVRRGFALGASSPDDQFALKTLIKGVINNPTSQPRFQALRAALHVFIIETLDHHWRSILAMSGLIFSPDIHYRKLIQNGHQQVSINGWTEAPCTAGRYLTSLEEGAFDGFVNIGAFNCTPASNATAVTHDMAIKSGLPYAVIEADGACITASQVRQLESIAAQCWEGKTNKQVFSKKL